MMLLDWIQSKLNSPALAATVILKQTPLLRIEQRLACLGRGGGGAAAATFGRPCCLKYSIMKQLENFVRRAYTIFRQFHLQAVLANDPASYRQHTEAAAAAYAQLLPKFRPAWKLWQARLFADVPGTLLVSDAALIFDLMAYDLVERELDSATMFPQNRIIRLVLRGELYEARDVIVNEVLPQRGGHAMHAERIASFLWQQIAALLQSYPIPAPLEGETYTDASQRFTSDMEDWKRDVMEVLHGANESHTSAPSDSSMQALALLHVLSGDAANLEPALHRLFPQAVAAALRLSQTEEDQLAADAGQTVGQQFIRLYNISQQLLFTAPVLTLTVEALQEIMVDTDLDVPSDLWAACHISLVSFPAFLRQQGLWMHQNAEDVLKKATSDAGGASGAATGAEGGSVDTSSTQSDPTEMAHAQKAEGFKLRALSMHALQVLWENGPQTFEDSSDLSWLDDCLADGSFPAHELLVEDPLLLTPGRDNLTLVDWTCLEHVQWILEEFPNSFWHIAVDYAVRVWDVRKGHKRACDCVKMVEIGSERRLRQQLHVISEAIHTLQLAACRFSEEAKLLSIEVGAERGGDQPVELPNENDCRELALRWKSLRRQKCREYGSYLQRQGPHALAQAALWFSRGRAWEQLMKCMEAGIQAALALPSERPASGGADGDGSFMDEDEEQDGLMGVDAAGPNRITHVTELLQGLASMTDLVDERTIARSKFQHKRQLRTTLRFMGLLQVMFQNLTSISVTVLNVKQRLPSVHADVIEMLPFGSGFYVHWRTAAQAVLGMVEAKDVPLEWTCSVFEQAMKCGLWSAPTIAAIMEPVTAEQNDVGCFWSHDELMILIQRLEQVEQELRSRPTQTRGPDGEEDRAEHEHDNKPLPMVVVAQWCDQLAAVRSAILDTQAVALVCGTQPESYLSEAEMATTVGTSDMADAASNLQTSAVSLAARSDETQQQQILRSLQRSMAEGSARLPEPIGRHGVFSTATQSLLRQYADLYLRSLYGHRVPAVADAPEDQRQKLHDVLQWGQKYASKQFATSSLRPVSPSPGRGAHFRAEPAATDGGFDLDMGIKSAASLRQSVFAQGVIREPDADNSDDDIPLGVPGQATEVRGSVLTQPSAAAKNKLFQSTRVTTEYRRTRGHLGASLSRLPSAPSGEPVPDTMPSGLQGASRWPGLHDSTRLGMTTMMGRMGGGEVSEAMDDTQGRMELNDL